MKILLLNNKHPLPEGYEPQLIEVQEGYQMDRNAGLCMRQMLYCAANDGVNLKIFSAYRSVDYQKKLFEDEVRTYLKDGLTHNEAIEKTLTDLAFPGHSEHNAGLAADITGYGVKNEMSLDFVKTPEYQWLSNNAHKYGFIMRYPKGKEHITGKQFEPWHYRFVGSPHAGIIKRKGITLEEYLAMNKCMIL